MNDENDNDSEIVDALGFCGCGLPIDATEFILDALEHIDRLKTEVWEKKLTHEQWKADGRKLFVNDGAEYFTYYVLDKMELIEHGGSVPGWLSPRGYELIEKIKAWQQT